jgi:hypothetical protein
MIGGHGTTAWRDLVSKPAAPVVLLFVVAGISLVLRLAFLSTPQFLIFDEHYYVNAARKIVSVPVPAGASA